MGRIYKNGVEYTSSGGGGSFSGSASDVMYNNVASGLSSSNVQGAVDEIVNQVNEMNSVLEGMVVEIGSKEWVKTSTDYTYTIPVANLTGSEIINVDLYDDGDLTEEKIHAYDISVEYIDVEAGQIVLHASEIISVDFTIVVRGAAGADTDGSGSSTIQAQVNSLNRQLTEVKNNTFNFTGSTEILENSDFNSLTTIGQYNIFSNYIMITCTNRPTNVAGTLLVTDCTGQYQITGDDGEYQYLVQVFISYTGDIWTRYYHRENTTETWEKWRKFDKSNSAWVMTTLEASKSTLTISDETINEYSLFDVYMNNKAVDFTIESISGTSATLSFSTAPAVATAVQIKVSNP